MAQLDYRAVNAPDLSNAMTGVTAANQMIQQALGTAQAGVNKFQGIQKDAASTELLSRLLAFQDPEAYKTALASGSLLDGIDRRNLSQEDLLRTDARGAQLINKATNELQFNTLKTNDERTRAQTAASDAAKPFMFQALTLANSGDKAGADKIIADNPGIFGNITIDQLRSAMANNTDLASGKRKYDWAGQDRSWELTQRDWTLEDRNTANAAIAAVQDIISHSGNKQDAEAYLQSQGYAPKVAAAVRQQLGLEAFPTFATDPLGNLGGGVGGGGGFNGANPLTIMNYEARASGFPAVPESVKTFGQASDFALQVNAANKKRTGEPGSSAMGLYQIVGSTMRDYAPKAFGANWRNVDFNNAANQDKVAQKIWESNNGSAEKIHSQWTSISVAEAKNLVGKPWNDTTRNIVARGESGGNAAALVRAALGGAVDKAVNTYNTNDQVGSTLVNSNAIRFGETQLDQTKIAQVANDLKKSTFPDASNSVLIARIQEIQSRGLAQKVKLSARSAADILESSVRPRGLGDKASDAAKTFVDPFGLFTERGGLGGNMEANYDLIDTMIRAAAPKKNANPDGTITSDNQDRIKSVTILQGQAALRDQAAGAVAQAQAALAQARAAQAAGRNINIAPYVMRLEQANALLVAASGEVTRPAPAIPTPATPPPSPRVAATAFDGYAAQAKPRALPPGFGLLAR